jgi:hypothetical protein
MVVLQLLRSPMPIRNKNLTILTDAEKRALYDLPDFDEFQRADYFSLSAQELALALRRDGISAQILCLLLIGYFKAKKAFFTFTLMEVPAEDIDFLTVRYFPGKSFNPGPMPAMVSELQKRQSITTQGSRLISPGFLCSCLNSEFCELPPKSFFKSS